MREQRITLPSSDLGGDDAIHQMLAQKGRGRFKWSWCEQRRERKIMNSLLVLLSLNSSGQG